MKSALPHPLLPQLSQLLEMEMGLYYPTTSWGDLERRIAAAAPALGMMDVGSCIRQLLSASLTRRQIEILARHLTVGETYFFREKGYFDVLEEHIFPQLLRACAHSHRQLRIWSAGCCTGEEPYSIAILLDRLGQYAPDTATIMATDINPVFLEKAATGLYGEWSFRGTPAWVKELYFKRRKNGQFELLPHIRKRVTFSYLNLAEESYPGITNGADAMDIIFCRNVLMYFSPDRVMRIGRNLHRSLTHGGWLILSPVEMSHNLFPQFKQTTFPTAILYHKPTITEPWENTGKHNAPMPDMQPDCGSMSVQALTPPLHVKDEKTLLSFKDSGMEWLIEAAAAMPAQTAEMGNAESPKDDEKFETLCHTARSYANLGKLTEAVSWCEKAIAVNKLNPAAHYLLATICQELGQSTTAIQSLRHTLYLDPDFVLAHFALGNLCMSLNRYREANRHFGNALALLSPHPYDELVPESNGLTAGRLSDIITSVRSSILLVPQESEAQ
ncbi:CheR family methyltransferase [Nitrosovibrio tenuis]|uniref:MCP methyltransferase, CheR-type n=1 Tax=Nitrosovibrio tenuis TaxID=1233 RepID=A0A1H7KGT0_9PROT|nr:protein-glutamate O-methyltransferase CheR [Nitrosovibrio tenuis]SEK85999.1 MCP methyltransferase, CheR-type [Nitrosovibrio tenuis]